MKKLLFLLTSICLLSTCFAFSSKPKPAYYQITVYHFKNEAQIKNVDAYLQAAYIPALHRAGVSKVGVFKPLANDTAADKRLYVFIPLKSMTQVDKIDVAIWKDEQFLTDGADYLNASFNNTNFVRKEAIVLKAFDKMLDFAVPNLTGTAAEKIYELRSYEGPTEKMYRKKVSMFNVGGEVALFIRLNFNAVFYGTVIAGSRMPNLMYMTSFNSKEERDAHWGVFKVDPEWKKLSAMPEYLNTVSKSDIILMHATNYSEL